MTCFINFSLFLLLLTLLIIIFGSNGRPDPYDANADNVFTDEDIARLHAEQEQADREFWGDDGWHL